MLVCPTIKAMYLVWALMKIKNKKDNIYKKILRKQPVMFNPPKITSVYKLEKFVKPIK